MHYLSGESQTKWMKFHRNADTSAGLTCLTTHLGLGGSGLTCSEPDAWGWVCPCREVAAMIISREVSCLLQRFTKC